MDVIEQIRRANAGREPQRLQLKYAAMRASPFAFLRGTCGLFYERLPRGGIFKSAPSVWLCGDLHLENFGSYKADNRLAYFDINDFDEAALGPATLDLVRFLTSVLIAAEHLGGNAQRRERLCSVFIEAYAAALVAGKAYWVERDTATGAIRALLDSLRERKRAAFLDTRTVLSGTGRTPTRVLRTDGKKAFPVAKAQRALVARFMRDFAATQPDPGFYEMLDVARRIAGTGSLGVARYVILVNGKGSPDGNYLLDLKASQPSSLSLVPGLLKRTQPRWASQAHRIASVQRRVQAATMAFLQPVWLEDRAFVLRALQPAEDRVALARLGDAPLAELIAHMGRIVAWAQLRSAGREGSAIADDLIAFGARKKWKRELMAAATDAAEQVRADAATYARAWDDGAFAA